MNALLLFCAYMALIYPPWHLFGKPLAHHEEVWFGLLFTGWAAKLLAVAHSALYAAGMFGFWGMRSWMWPWASVYVGPGRLRDGGVARPAAGRRAGSLIGAAAGAAGGRASRWPPPGRLRGAPRSPRSALRRVGAVTGASSGIGAEMARAPPEGVSCVLRRAGRAASGVGGRLAKDHVETRVVALDLRTERAPTTRRAAETSGGRARERRGLRPYGAIRQAGARRMRDMVVPALRAPASSPAASFPACASGGAAR